MTPSRAENDKLIWFLLVFFGNILGALLFFIWSWEKAPWPKLRDQERLDRRLESALKDFQRSTPGSGKEEPAH